MCINDGPALTVRGVKGWCSCCRVKPSVLQLTLTSTSTHSEGVSFEPLQCVCGLLL